MQKNFLNKNFEKVKDYWEKKEKEIVKNPRKQFTFFILAFILFYLLFTALMIPFEDSTKAFTGSVTEGLLGMQGLEASDGGMFESEGENVYSFFVKEKQIIISWLCTGITEIIILMSAIIASFGIAWKKKLLGVLGAIIAGLLFNFLRIWITINIILTQEAQVFEFAHDLLFRLILFLYIIVFYVIWFYYSNKK
jgi:exosortase/archaeosortase family protein